MKCRICGEKMKIFIDLTNIPLSVTGDCRIVNEGVKVYRCSYCGFVQKESTDKIQAKYFNDFASHITSTQTEQMKFVNGKQVPRSELITKKIKNFIPTNGKLLDIGTGNGAFLKAFIRDNSGWEIFAQDIHPNFKKEIVSL